MSEAAFVPNQTFEEYQERFKDYFAITRKDGIVEVRMHENGGVSMWKKEHNFGWGAVLRAIGADTENEVLIFGGTGDMWAKDMDPEYVKQVMIMMKENPAAFNTLFFDTYQRVAKMIQAMFYEVDIPTIGVINGPSSGHMEIALLSDFCLCAPNVEFRSSHFVNGMVPGDGTFFAMQFLLGPARANHLTITGESFTAQQAYDWGMVGEVVPTEEIYARAWEIAGEIMQKSRPVRRLTHELMRRAGRRFFTEEYNFQAGMQGWSGSLGTSDLNQALDKATAGKE